MQNGLVESFVGRMRDKILNKTLFFTVRQARSIMLAGLMITTPNGRIPRPVSTNAWLLPENSNNGRV